MLSTIKQIGQSSFFGASLLLISCQNERVDYSTCTSSEAQTCETYTEVKSNNTWVRDGWSTTYYGDVIGSRCAYNYGKKVFCLNMGSHGDTALVIRNDGVKYSVVSTATGYSNLVVNSEYRKDLYHIDFVKGKLEQLRRYNSVSEQVDTIIVDSLWNCTH